MSKFCTEICLMFLIFFNGTQCVAWKRVYTTAGSFLRLNMIDLEESIHCDFFPTGQKIKKRIVNASKQYDLTKYQLTTSIRPTITIQAPEVIGSFPKGLHILDLERKTLHITDKLLAVGNETYGTEGSQINLTFTLNTTQSLSDNSLRLDEDAEKYYFQFTLKIKNASTEDDGMYKCLIVTPWIDIVVAPIRFLYQTDDNIIYGQEEQAMSISCENVSGHKQDTLYIKQNGTTLSASKNGTVTFTFIPDRHDNFKEYECVGGQAFASVRVKLFVNYAPVVQVIALEHSLDCFATGFPQTYTFKKWEHQSEDGEHIRFLNGLNNRTLNLEMLKMKYQISGRYICTVSNGIPDVNGSLFQMGSINFKYTGHPIFASENRKIKDIQLYKSITLTFLIYSDPIVEEIRITGVAADHEKNENIHEFKLSGTDLVYTEFDQKGKIKGYTISFNFQMFSSDFVKYNILARNARGEDSFYFKIRTTGEPIFAPENQNVKHGELGQPLTLTFVLYSNPIMTDIWIDSASTENNQAITQDTYDISKRTLPYTVFGNKGNISGYEISFETKILGSNDFHEYYVWSKNEFGDDFYRFEIIKLASPNCKVTDRTRFITSSCIAAGLLIYIITVHICLSVKHRMLHGMQRTTPAELPYHTYDEIGSLSNQAAIVRYLVGDQQGLSQQTRFGQSSQIAFSQIDINNQMLLDNRPDTTSSVFPQDYPEITAPQNDISEETIELPSPLSVEEIMYRYRNCIEEDNTASDDSLHSFQRGRNQGEGSSITNLTSSSSTDSVGSNIESLYSTSVDRYENPYQIIMQIQDTHQYTSIIHPLEKKDATDYINV